MAWHVSISSLVPQGRLAEVLTVIHETAGGIKRVMTGITWHHLGRDGGFPIPTEEPLICEGVAALGFVRNSMDDFLQAVMDCAWKRGLRPSGYEGPQEVAAVRAHLADMQRLVFEKPAEEFKVKEPE